jgi:hypothetical protein
MTLATLQTLGNGGRLILSDAQTLKSLHEFSCDAGFNQGAAFSGDDNRVFYYDQGRISVRNVASGRHLLTLDPGFRSGMCLECDPQTGNLVVLDARSGPRAGRMWRVPSFAEIEAAEDVNAETAGVVTSK